LGLKFLNSLTSRLSGREHEYLLSAESYCPPLILSVKAHHHTPERMSKMIQNLERVRYFFGKLMSVEDFQEEQSYFLNRLRRHNRFLHGWGVIAGLDVSISKSNEVVVSAGHAIDCTGNEIAVPEPILIPVCTKKGTLYVAIQYQELQVSPEPTGEGVEFSRIRESAEVVRLELNPAAQHRGIGPRTPGCGQPHPLCLAKLTWSQSNLQLRKIRNRA
jgi:hypothetical protein